LRIKEKSRFLPAALAVSLVLALVSGLAVTIGLAQSPMPGTWRVEHALSPDVIWEGQSTAGLLTVRNQSAQTMSLDSVSVNLTEGLTYVGQAMGSDVTAAAQVDGTTLVWVGPFRLASGDLLTLRYWVVATQAKPGQYLVKATIHSGGDLLDAGVAPIEITSGSRPSAIEPVTSENRTVVQGVAQDVAALKIAEPEILEPGGPVAYTVVFSNSTASDMALSVIKDVLPASFHYVGLAAGSEVSVEPVDTQEPEIVWQGTFTVPAASTLTLRYWVWVLAEAVPGTTPYTNTVTAVYTGTVVGPAEAPVTLVGPHVLVSKDAWPLEVIVAEPVTYTVVMANEGNGQGVVDVISDTLPAGFAFLGMLPGGTITDAPAGITGTIVWSGPFTLPVGSAITLTYQARASMASGSESATNQVVAQVDGAVTESAKATIQVKPFYSFLPLALRNWIAPYFDVTKEASAAQVNQGEDVIYTVTFVNGGSKDGVLDKISDVLPAGFTFKSMETGSDVLVAPIGTTGTIVWNGPFTVGPGESLILIYRVQVSDVPGTYVNSATATTLVGFAPEEPAGATVQVKEPILLWEDFESGTDGWEPFLNYWRLHPEQWYLEGGSGYGGSTGLRHTYWLGASEPARGAHDALYMYRGAGSEQWADYRMEARVRIDAGDKMGFWVRGKYVESTVDGLHVEGYYVDWRPNRDTNGVELWAIRDSGSTAFHFSDPVLLAVGQRLMSTYTWYQLAVEVRGSDIKVFVDGDLVIDYNDSTWQEGTVGFFAYKAGYATWDDVLVTPLD
jgi:uncharacterized repeat protein (TIGR01451 family)